MEIKNLTYLLLLLVYLAIPIGLSVRSKVRIALRLRFILPAILFGGAIFVMWDIRFTEMEIWKFNPEYITGIELLRIPIEEWLSFLLISMSSIYIYEWLKVRLSHFEKPNFFVALSLVIFATSGILAYIYRQNMFSFFTFFLTAIYLGYTIFRNRFKKSFTKFYISYFISLVPFALTGVTLNSFPVVTYNVSHIMGIALLGIPVEKLSYLYLLLLINITIYEYLCNKYS